MTQTKFKPCPFCGNTLNIILMKNNHQYNMACNFCGAQGGIGETAEKAIKAWNRRTP